MIEGFAELLKLFGQRKQEGPQRHLRQVADKQEQHHACI